MRRLLLLCAVLAGCDSSGETPPPPPPDPFPAPADGARYHGVFPGDTSGLENTITPGRLAEYEGAAGLPAAWVYFSHEWGEGRAFPAAQVGWIAAQGKVPYIRLMLRSSTEQDQAEPLFTPDRIIAGDFDTDLRRWARAARDAGTPILAEYGTEMNGEWFGWNGKWSGAGTLTGYGDPTLPDGPERFRDAYRHIIDLMRQEEARNVAWVFHVNDGDYPATAWNRFEQYYPGDDDIAWLAVSVYGAQTPQDAEWPRFRDGMDSAYARLAALAPGKPVIVAEFGVTRDNPLGDQAAWADSALTDLLVGRWPAVIGFSWWNEGWPNDDDPAHDTNMRLQDNPPLSAVFTARLTGSPTLKGQYP